MAKIVIPDQPDPINTLGNDIVAKHTADGAASPIPAALITQLTAKLTEGDSNYTLQKDLDKQKEKHTEDRNISLGLHETQSSITEGTVLFYVTSIRNFLLGHFRGSERKLGDYGYVVNSPKGKVQVVIPRNPEKLIKLGQAILKKHTDDGVDSILSSFNMATMTTLVSEANTRNDQAAKANRDKEKATQNRNVALGTAKGQNRKTVGTATYIICSIRDILLGIYRGKEQTLGDWGYTVNFNTTPPPTPPPAPGG